MVSGAAGAPSNLISRMMAYPCISLDAGCDVGLHCNGNVHEMELVAKACPGTDNVAKSRINIFLKKVADVSDRREIFDINELKSSLSEGLKGFFNFS